MFSIIDLAKWASRITRKNVKRMPIMKEATGILSPYSAQNQTCFGARIGRSTPRSLYTLLNLCMSLFCLLRVWLFAMGRVLT